METLQEEVALKSRNTQQNIVETSNESNDTVECDRCEHPRAIIEMIITDMQTHEKYRVLKVLQAFAHFMTNGAFVSLIFVIFILRTSQDPNKVSTDLTIEQIIQNPVLVAVLLLDAFHSILLKETHIWMLIRLGLLIPVIFNLSYLIIFSVKKMWTDIIILLFTLRIFAYLYELFIMYCFDLEIAYDLSIGKIMELWRCDNYKQICTRYNNQTTERLYNQTEKYILILHDTRVLYFKCVDTDCDINKDEQYVQNQSKDDNILRMPDGTIYCGSICSWTIYNVFKWKPIKEDAEKNCGSWHWFVRWCIRIMVATIPLLLDLCLIMVGAMVSLVGYFCVMIVSCCKGDCIKFDYKNLMIGEMFHEKAT